MTTGTMDVSLVNGSDDLYPEYDECQRCMRPETTALGEIGKDTRFQHESPESAAPRRLGKACGGPTGSRCSADLQSPGPVSEK